MPGRKEGTDGGGDVCIMLFPFPSSGQGSDPLDGRVRTEPGCVGRPCVRPSTQALLRGGPGHTQGGDGAFSPEQATDPAPAGPSGVPGSLTRRALGTGSRHGRPP